MRKDNEGGFYLDTEEFEEDLTKLIKRTVPSLAEKGGFAAGSEMLRDADKEEPKTPFKRGDLRGSKRVEVETKIGEILIRAGFDIEYAAGQHEREKRESSSYNLPGSGPKFLETKVVRYRIKYMTIIADRIAKG